MRITFETSKTITSLINDLEKDFPNKIPINSSPSLEEIRRLQGHQEVIQWIKNLLSDEEDEDKG